MRALQWTVSSFFDLIPRKTSQNVSELNLFCAASETEQFLGHECCCFGCDKPAASMEKKHHKECLIPESIIKQSWKGVVMKRDAEKWYEGQYVTCTRKEHRMGKGQSTGFRRFAKDKLRESARKIDKAHRAVVAERPKKKKRVSVRSVKIVKVRCLLSTQIKRVSLFSFLRSRRAPAGIRSRQWPRNPGTLQKIRQSLRRQN